MSFFLKFHAEGPIFYKDQALINAARKGILLQRISSYHTNRELYFCGRFVYKHVVCSTLYIVYTLLGNKSTTVCCFSLRLLQFLQHSLHSIYKIFKEQHLRKTFTIALMVRKCKKKCTRRMDYLFSDLTGT